MFKFTENNKFVTGFIDEKIFTHRIGSEIEDDIKLYLLSNYIETSKNMISHSDRNIKINKMYLDSRKMKLKD